MLSLCLTTAARADRHRDLTDSTGWLYYADVDVATLNTQLAAGFRIVDLDVVQASPLLFDAALVSNNGAYASGWWWYLDSTRSQLMSLATQNNARIVDLTAYQTANGLRYACVMVPNAGVDQLTWAFEENLTSAQITAWLNKSGPLAPFGRIYDIEACTTANGTRYAVIGVSNAIDGVNWGVSYGLSSAALESAVNAAGARIVDLELEPNGTFTAIWETKFAQSSHWFADLPFSEVGTVATQYASRIVEITRYTSGATVKYAIALRKNAAEPTYTLNRNMRALLTNPLTDSGFLVRELDAGVRTAVNEAQVFEPASTLKTAYAFTAMLRVALGSDALSNTVNSPTQLSGLSCPNPGSPWEGNTLANTLMGMLQNSDNLFAEGIRARYGSPAIISNAQLAGATDVDINHTLGCDPIGGFENTITLHDLHAIHAAASGGLLGSQEAAFRSLFRNYGNLPNVDGIVSEELARSGLSSSDRAEFLSHFRMSAKGGAYDFSGVYFRSSGFYMSVPVKAFGCAIVEREFFFGAFLNDHDSMTEANSAIAAIERELTRIPLREALETWRNAADPLHGGELAQHTDDARAGARSALARAHLTRGALSGSLSGAPAQDPTKRLPFNNHKFTRARPKITTAMLLIPPISTLLNKESAPAKAATKQIKDAAEAPVKTSATLIPSAPAAPVSP